MEMKRPFLVTLP